MTLDPATIAAIAAAVADRLGTPSVPPGWPANRGNISESECAEFLAIGCEFLRALRMDGKITATKIGRRVLYAPGDVSEFLARCKSEI